ncbi:hypothetical protein B0H12DRAFT_1106779 [Mycena haematopus]|nr:hypothetical protein B0H12DRAFT_1106779 [Mycena haematopus]
MSLRELEGLRTRSRLAIKRFDETCRLEALRGTESCEGGKWEGARWGKEEERNKPFDRSCDGCLEF